MKAVELAAFEGAGALRLVETGIPVPGPEQVLIEVKAAGINFAELELTKGRYPYGKQPPFVMGFEAAGVVAKVGGMVRSIQPGDRVAAVVSSGGYAEYATADAAACIPIPKGISFAEATTLPIQGLSAYAMLELAARPKPGESILVQAAAGGVGLFLVQLARMMGAGKLVALAGSGEKIRLLRSLGVEAAIDYSEPGWTDKARAALDGVGADIVLEAASGEVGRQSFALLAPFGRMVMFGARNIHDTLSPEQLRQLITRNQSIAGFNFPSLRPEQIAACVPKLLRLISTGQVKLFARTSFALGDVAAAYEAMSSRRTIGKVVLIP